MTEEKEYKLPREFGEKWIEALESGDYKQTNGVLYKDGGFCCIGVAARLHYPLHYLKSSEDTFGGVIEKGNGIHDLKYDLKKIPKELKGNIRNNSLVSNLVDLNDSEGYSFEEIAEWLKENVEFYD